MAFGYLLTQEARARECHSLLSSCSRFNKKRGERGKTSGAQGGADRATANTKNGCGSAPLLSPLCRNNTLKMRESVVYFEGFLFQMSRHK